MFNMLLNFENYITENTVLTIKNPKINIKIAVEDTKHSKERQSRHEKEGIAITDNEIVATMRKAIPKISKELILDKIDVGNTICIKYNGLNIITALNKKGDDLEFKLVTVMKKDNFKAKSGTYVMNI